MSTAAEQPLIRKASRIHGLRLSMRDACEADAGFIHKLRCQPDRARYLSVVSANLKAQVEWLRQYAKDDTQAYFVIEDVETSRAMGTVRLYGARNNAFSWGSWILEAEAPTFCAIESALMVYHYGLALGFSSAYFEVMQGNRAVWRFHERFGAQRVGMARGQFQYVLSNTEMVASLKKYHRFLPNGIRVEP